MLGYHHNTTHEVIFKLTFGGERGTLLDTGPKTRDHKAIHYHTFTPVSNPTLPASFLCIGGLALV